MPDSANNSETIKSPKNSQKNKSFESAMARLDIIVRGLERGDAPLSDALALFEEGAGLIKFCSNLLDSAEQKVMTLKKSEGGAPIELPFEDKDD